MSNIDHIKEKNTALSASDLFSSEIIEMLIRHLNVLLGIIIDINDTSITDIKDSYKTFGINSWKITHSLEEYNKYISKILFNQTTATIDSYKLNPTKIYKFADMSNIIPNENTASLIKTPETNSYSYESKPIIINEIKVNYKPNIFILPGCAENYQTLDRVLLFKNLIKTMGSESIDCIIVSGRGNGLKLDSNGQIIDNNNFDEDIIKQIENTDISNKRFVTIPEFNKTNITNVIKYGELKRIPLDANNDRTRSKKIFTHFKTEAYYMAIEVKKILNELYSDRPKPKIYLEPLALETAGNFIFSPFSCFYEYNDDDTITFNPKTDENASQFYKKLLEYNLHIISHDYHILRCINTSMQTLRPSLEDSRVVEDYGNIYYYTVRDIETSSRIFAANYFTSFTQPYDIFFDIASIETGDMDYSFSNTIKYSRTTTKLNPNNNPYEYLFYLLIKLLTYHGIYSNISNQRVLGYRFSNLLCMIYPNILRCNFNGAVFVGGYINSIHKHKSHKHKSHKHKTHKHKTHKD